MTDIRDGATEDEDYWGAGRMGNANELYTIEEILGYRREGRKEFFRIKWRGYPLEDATWEPGSNILAPGEELQRVMHQFRDAWAPITGAARGRSRGARASPYQRREQETFKDIRQEAEPLFSKTHSLSPLYSDGVCDPSPCNTLPPEPIKTQAISDQSGNRTPAVPESLRKRAEDSSYPIEVDHNDSIPRPNWSGPGSGCSVSQEVRSKEEAEIREEERWVERIYRTGETPQADASAIRRANVFVAFRSRHKLVRSGVMVGISERIDHLQIDEAGKAFPQELLQYLLTKMEYRSVAKAPGGELQVGP